MEEGVNLLVLEEREVCVIGVVCSIGNEEAMPLARIESENRIKQCTAVFGGPTSICGEKQKLQGVLADPSYEESNPENGTGSNCTLKGVQTVGCGEGEIAVTLKDRVAFWGVLTRAGQPKALELLQFEVFVTSSSAEGGQSRVGSERTSRCHVLDLFIFFLFSFSGLAGAWVGC